jgi:diacylglycerol kinase family enzyme
MSTTTRSLPGRIGRGAGVAVVFNVRARQVSFEALEAIHRALPDAALVATGSVAACETEVAKLASRPGAVRLLLSAGGDGAVAALIGAWVKTQLPLPPLGLLPLGTGNAWAHATHAPRLSQLLEALPRLRWPVPSRRFALLDVGGTWCQFAGSGWDATLLDDYARHRDSAWARLLPRPLREGLGGYLAAAFRYTVPQGLVRDRAEAVVESSEPWFAVGPGERLVEAAPGTLWEGPFSVLAMGTTTQYGFHFEAFPFAGAVAGTFNLRVYDRPLWRALPQLPRLWRGTHPLVGMHDFFASSVRITLHPPMPVQLAGDDVGERASLDVRLAEQGVEVVDWLEVTPRRRRH